jgi:outer membrane receptor for ferrienterochelin and colicins
LGARTRFENGIELRVSYAYQKTEDQSTSSELSNSPNHLGKLNLILPFYQDKVFGGVELQYRSEAKTLLGRETDPFLMVNLTLFTQRIVKGLEASASVYNLLDTKYYYPAAAEHLQDQIEQDGRGFRVKLTYRF